MVAKQQGCHSISPAGNEKNEYMVHPTFPPYEFEYGSVLIYGYLIKTYFYPLEFLQIYVSFLLLLHS